MRTHIFFAFAVLLLAPLAAAAAPADPRMEQAVKAYESNKQAEADKARDQLIANHMEELANDPATPVIGNPHGDVLVVEFFDYACPYCKAVEPRLEALVRADKGVKLAIKEFPILTPQSMIAARAGLAAARQGKYAPFHNILMNYRGELSEPVIFDTAKIAGLDIARLRKDMAAPEIADALIANFNLARGVRIFQTPGFIIGGHVVSSDSANINFPKLVAAARGK